VELDARLLCQCCPHAANGYHGNSRPWVGRYSRKGVQKMIYAEIEPAGLSVKMAVLPFVLLHLEVLSPDSLMQRGQQPGANI
jgi:hypothetical protein